MRPERRAESPARMRLWTTQPGPASDAPSHNRSTPHEARAAGTRSRELESRSHDAPLHHVRPVEARRGDAEDDRARERRARLRQRHRHLDGLRMPQDVELPGVGSGHIGPRGGCRADEPREDDEQTGQRSDHDVAWCKSDAAAAPAARFGFGVRPGTVCARPCTAPCTGARSEAVALELVPERALAHAEEARGLRLVVVRGAQRAQDELALELLDRRPEEQALARGFLRRRSPAPARAGAAERSSRPPRVHRRARRPAPSGSAARARSPATSCCSSTRQAAGVSRSGGLAELAREVAQEVRGERADVLAPLAQRRQLDVEHVQPVEEILPEAARRESPPRDRDAWSTARARRPRRACCCRPAR